MGFTVQGIFVIVPRVTFILCTCNLVVIIPNNKKTAAHRSRGRRQIAEPRKISRSSIFLYCLHHSLFISIISQQVVSEQG